MLSLCNVWNISDIQKFYKRVQKQTPQIINQDTFWSSPKIDGIAVSLKYIDNIFIAAITRGDGKQGELIDVSYVQNIPKYINMSNHIEIRGEIVLYKKDFQDHFSKQFSNPRNAVSGIIKRKELHKLSKFFIFFPYSCVPYSDKYDFININNLQKEGFILMPFMRICNNPQDIVDYHDFIIKQELPFESDGSVHKINDLSVIEEYGNTIKYPKYAIAYKTSSKEFPSYINSIEFTVGKSGKITPVANIHPIQIEGSTINKVTVHNIDQIIKLNIGKDQIIYIQKAGKTIPKITRVCENLKGNTQIPEHCPSCGNKLYNYQCIQDWECSGITSMRLIYFISKPCFNIQGLGKQAIDQLVSKKMVKRPTCLFKLTINDWLCLDLISNKKANNIIKEIQKKSKISLGKFLASLSIPRLGLGACSKLAKTYKDINSIINQKDLKHIIGKVGSDSVIEYFKYQIGWIKELIDYVEIF